MTFTFKKNNILINCKMRIVVEFVLNFFNNKIEDVIISDSYIRMLFKNDYGIEFMNVYFHEPKSDQVSITFFKEQKEEHVLFDNLQSFRDWFLKAVF